MNRQFQRSGEIRDLDLLSALVGLWRDRASVTLDFTRGGITAGLDISEGEIIATFAADPRFETSAILVRAGKLDGAALERLAVPEGSDRAMAAMQAGVLTRREWKWGEKIRAIEVLADLLTWNDGHYASEPDTRSVSGEFHLSIPRLLLELFLRSRDRALVEHQLGNPDARLLRSEDFDAQFSTFGLTADAESVVRLIDGKATAREIASRAPADVFAVEKLLAALVTLGLLRPGDSPSGAWPEEGASPTESAAPSALEEGLEQPSAEGGRSRELLDAQLERPAEGAAARAKTSPGFPDLPEPAPPDHEVIPEIASEAPAFGASDTFETRTLEPGVLHAELPPEAPSSWNTLAPGPTDPVLERVEDPVEDPVRRGQGLLLVGVFFALAAAVAGVLLFRSRTGGGGAGPVQPPERTVAAWAPTPAALPTEAPAPSPVPPPTAKPAAVRPGPPIPTIRPTVTSPVKAPAHAAAQPPERKPWQDRAEAGRKRLASEPNTRYAVQLLLACEVSTLEDAFRHEQPAGSMWLLATDHKGRPCFKVLWGRFGSAEEARKAKDGVPSHFVSSSNRPAVVAVR